MIALFRQKERVVRRSAAEQNPNLTPVRVDAHDIAVAQVVVVIGQDETPRVTGKQLSIERNVREEPGRRAWTSDQECFL